MARETRNDFYPTPIVDQNMRPGVITRLIIFIVVLTGSAIVFGIFRERLGDPFLLGMLGILAMIGVGYLFTTARHQALHLLRQRKIISIESIAEIEALAISTDEPGALTSTRGP